MESEPGGAKAETPEAPGENAAIDARAAAALSRELADFLIELSIAIHKHAMYPPDHPLLPPAADAVAARLASLLENKTSLSIGVARKQLVIEGVATDSKNPVLSDLSARLHEHELGAIAFTRGVTTYSIEGFLRLVAADASKQQPLGQSDADQLTSLPHIRMYPVAYDRLQILGDELEDDDEYQLARTRSAQLWVGLARAALALEEIDDSEEDLEAEPSVVARAMSDHPRGRAYDQVIVGYLMQIAEELKSAGGTDALALKSRMSKLISHLEPATLQQIMSMGGDRQQRRQFLIDAAQGMSVDAVIKLAHAASQSQQQSISHSFLRILQKLAHHTETGSRGRRRAADRSVREQISQMIEGWSLIDPNPDEYTSALRRMARNTPMYRVSPDRSHAPEPRRVIQMALEVNTTGPTVMHAVDELVDSQQLKWLVDVMEEADAPSVTGAIWGDLATSERLGPILSQEPIDVEALDGLLPKLGPKAVEPMIEALTESDSRQTRRVLLDRLKDMGPSVAAFAVARLADSRWFVQRNMLTIIGSLPEVPEGFRPDDFFRHPDDRVRREALRILIDSPNHRERAVCRAISDSDERTVRLGLASALIDCPKPAVPLVISRAAHGLSDDQRVAAIRVLGRLGNAQALDVLLKLTVPKKTLLGWRDPHKSAPYLAALRALVEFKDQRKVRDVLVRAASSKDSEVAAAASGHPTVKSN